ncbi:hypothetical protein HETIRDRAFT_410641 [Heterobasidion irregulare TC 32-1]|uniref:Uncharacterized protein n=1 Tax=Heterobasidion irregulare (strain TC 32-1) TaxID=747525 RepID=W4JYR6_HETIT|nr:uncharacterized protein HETIRDRAFT_410641 [Heterobasidion irregulare TC 32-1]ETW78599.1 hypothetical protein HETIRDRAFT_410641 [Heterobasidion irregulare TC 32-1]
MIFIGSVRGLKRRRTIEKGSSRSDATVGSLVRVLYRWLTCPPLMSTDVGLWARHVLWSRFNFASAAHMMDDVIVEAKSNCRKRSL